MGSVIIGFDPISDQMHRQRQHWKFLKKIPPPQTHLGPLQTNASRLEIFEKIPPLRCSVVNLRKGN